MITPQLGSGGGGAGSSWVSTSHLTSFTNGSNPTFTAGSATSTSCGQSTAQGTTGASNGAGGKNDPSTSGATGTGYTGCPGGITLTWSALPGAPTGVSGTAGNGQITASWTAPSDSGTASLTGYKVTATPTPSGTAVSQTFNSTATTETLTGLTNGVSYNVSVAAITSVGTGPAASASNNPITVGVAPAITSGTSTTFTEGSNGHIHGDNHRCPQPDPDQDGHTSERRVLCRQRQRHGHLVGHPGGRYSRHLPAHHHGGQRGRFQRHPELHPDGQRRAGHHLGGQRHLHRRDESVLHGDDDRSTHTSAVRDRSVTQWRDVCRQRKRHRHPGRNRGPGHPGHLPTYHHGGQRGRLQRHPELHPDGQRRAGHHLGRQHHLHRRPERDLHRDLVGLAHGGRCRKPEHSPRV